MKKNIADFERVFVSGGTVGIDTFKKAFNSDSTGGFKDTAYSSLTAEMENGFTAFEKSCDNYLWRLCVMPNINRLRQNPMLAYIYAGKQRQKP